MLGQSGECYSCLEDGAAALAVLRGSKEDPANLAHGAWPAHGSCPMSYSVAAANKTSRVSLRRASFSRHDPRSNPRWHRNLQPRAALGRPASRVSKGARSLTPAPHFRPGAHWSRQVSRQRVFPSARADPGWPRPRGCWSRLRRRWEGAGALPGPVS